MRGLSGHGLEHIVCARVLFVSLFFAADGSGLGTSSCVDRHSVKGNHSVRTWSLCSRVFALQETDNLLCAMLAAMGDHCSPKSGMLGTKPFGDVQRKRSHAFGTVGRDESLAISAEVDSQ